MNNQHARVGAIALAAASLSLLSPMGLASADPAGDPFNLVCDNGQTYSIVTTRGQGEFTPAFDTDSTRVFVPVSFGAFSGAIYDATTGDLVGSFTDPAVATKGSGKQRATTECTYTFRDTFTVSEEEAAAGDPNDPEYLLAGTYLFEGSGLVVGKITGR